MKVFFCCPAAGLPATGRCRPKPRPLPPPPPAPGSPYRASATKTNDLVHTKLAVRFDYAKRYLYGQEWVTLKPHGYATDSLRLDAKGMDIKTVSFDERQQASSRLSTTIPTS